MRASDLIVDSQTSLLLKGPFGHGKTLALASFAVEGPIYLAYFDKKKPIELMTYFMKFGERGMKILRNIEYDIYSSQNANAYLNKLMDLSKDCRYFAVGTDSVTNLTSAAVNWSLGFRDNKKAKDKDKIMPDFDEYKVETSLVTQALDICRTLPCHILWTAHPIPGIKIEGSGASIKVTKVNPIVTYGSKVAGIIPGNFSEIYHFTKGNDYDTTTGKSKIKFGVSFDAIGDDFAKSNIGLKGEIDITDAFFYDVWKDRVAKHMKELKDDLIKQTETNVNKDNPFNTQPLAQISQPIETRKWNSDKGTYE
jgi:hypothetical protein